MSKIFNSPTEVGLRALILLSERDDLSLDNLVLFDMLCTYGKFFGISEENLNGDNDLAISEIRARKNVMFDALKMYIKNGTISVSATCDGYTYRITETGRKSVLSLKTEYSRRYRECCVLVMNLLRNKTTDKLLEIIFQRGDAHHGD